MRMLLTGAINWTEEHKDEIRNLGNEIIYIQDERITLIEQNVDIACIEGVICNGLFLYNDITCFKNLKYVQLTSAGYDRVPIDYINEHNIKIHNARNVYSIPMSEFAVNGVLQLYKQSCFFYENQRSHEWKKNKDIIELYAKTVCIIGCGSVGNECAKRFKAFGCQVVGIDLYPRKDESYEVIVCLENIESVLSECDVVILTLPLTNETKHLMDAKKLELLKSRTILVNIARGEIVDTDALIDVLPNIGGAVLDVFEEEPLSKDSRLWKMKNVIITPHNCFVGEGNRKRLQEIIIENIKKRNIKYESYKNVY